MKWLKKLFGLIDFEIGFWSSLGILRLLKRALYDEIIQDLATWRKNAKEYYFTHTFEERQKATEDAIATLKLFEKE